MVKTNPQIVCVLNYHKLVGQTLFQAVYTYDFI